MAPSALKKLLCIPLPPSNEKASRDTSQEECVMDTKASMSHAHASDRSALQAIKDVPPPYSELSRVTIGDASGISTNGSDRSTSYSDPDSWVQICPHEILTSERFQRILNLPKFKDGDDKIDALSPTSSCHHRGHDKATKECQDSCKPLDIAQHPGFVAKLKGFGSYAYKASPPAKYVPGLVLSFHWEMKCLDSSDVEYDSTMELQQFLEQTRIWLCPHKKISDMDIVNRIHPIINPNGKPADPIDRYLAKGERLDCEHCTTSIRVYRRTGGIQGKTCRVDTTRCLGTGLERGYSIWRDQCRD